MDPFDDESTDGQKFVGRLNAGPETRIKRKVRSRGLEPPRYFYH